jgi:hypothetical protein
MWRYLVLAILLVTLWPQTPINAAPAAQTPSPQCPSLGAMTLQAGNIAVIGAPAGWKLRMFAREQRDDNGGNTSVDKSAPRSPKHGHADAGRDRSGSGAHAPHGRGSHSYQNSRDTQTQHESKGVDTSLDSSANRHMAHSSSRSEEATTTLVYETAWEDVNVWPAPSDYAPRMRHDGRKIGPEAAPAFSMGVKVKDKEVEGTPGPGRCVGSRVCVCA